MSTIYIHDCDSKNAGAGQQQQYVQPTSNTQQQQQQSSSSSQSPSQAPFNRPASQVVGLEDVLDVDDKMEHTQQPNPNTFQEQSPSNAEQMAYVQRCLLQLKDRMQQQVRDSESKSRGQATPTPSEDLAYAVQTSMLNKHVRNALQKEKDRSTQYLQQQAQQQQQEQDEKQRTREQEERNSSNTRTKQRTQAPSTSTASSKQHQSLDGKNLKDLFAFDQQSDIDFDARQARYIMEKAKREEGDSEDTNQQQTKGRDYVDDSDTGMYCIILILILSIVT
jgi:hypothetical protein